MMYKNRLNVLFFIAFSFFSFQKTFSQCFEIESILVNACATGANEGFNEMVRFKIGPVAQNSNNLVVTWPNNSWLGVVQNIATATKVATLNADIAAAGGCRRLIEPPGGVIPANASVILVTSYLLDTALNSFGALTSDIYIIFQNNGTVIAGHFGNGGTGIRTLIMTFGGTCSDTVSYAPSLLTTGTGGTGGDGATVLYTPSGTETYVNNGCVAPVPLFTVDAGTAQSVCTGATVALTGSVQGQQSVAWSAPSGSFSTSNATTTNYTVGAGITGAVVLTLSATNTCGVVITDTLTLNVAAAVTPTFTAITPICSGTSLSALPITSNNSVTGTWTPALNNTATTSYAFTPTAGQCAATATMTITVNPIPAAPTGATAQTLCSSPAPTIASLTATGTAIQWYIAATGGTALATTTALVNGTTYYASQTVSSCKSTRLGVTISLNDPQISASATAVCSGTPVNLTANNSAQNVNSCTGVSNYNFLNFTSIAPVGNYTNLIKKSNEFYLRSNNDVYKSSNLAGPYSSLNFNSQIGINEAGQLLGFDNLNRLHISTSHNGLYLNDGVNWSSNGLIGFGTAGQYFTKLSNGRIVISKGGFLRDIYYSDDNGITWINATNIDVDWNNLVIASNGDLYASSGVGGVNNKGIIKSIDNGSSWFYINSNLGIISSTGIFKDCINNLFIVGDNKIFKSTNDGATWNIIANIPPIFTSFPSYGQFVVASSGDFYYQGESYLFFSNNQGITWTQITNIPGNFGTIREVDGNIVVCSTQGLYAKTLSNNTTFLWSTGEITATINPSSTATTTYWCDVTVNGVTCRKEVTITVNSTTPAPTGTATQVFCVSPVPTVASLTATGTGIQWYTAATGGSLVASSTALVDGNTYYASQTVNGCESITRLEVTVDFNDPQITTSATTICIGETVNLAVNYTNTTLCNMNITPNNIPLGNSIPGFTYGGTFNGHYYYVYNTPTSWTGGELICRQNGGYLVCINDINENTFISNLTNNNIWIGMFRDPTTCQFRWLDCMNITFINWRPGEPNSDPCGEPYVQIIRGCSFGLNTWNNLNDNSSNGACYSNMVPIMEIDPFYYNPTSVSLLWSTGETTPTINPIPTTTTTYWCDVTVNGVTCRKSVTITVNPNITPTFTQVTAICSGTTLSALPTTSNNSVTGTWSPALNNLATTTYTFAPASGQCAVSAPLTIVVNPKITPTFTAVASICSGTTLSALPTTSTNSIPGTWSPALNNLATTTYTFAPASGQCAVSTPLTIVVSSNITPTFTAVAPICSGTTLSALPTTSNNSISGTWSPALNNLATTTYTFAPASGQCAVNTTLTVTVQSVIDFTISGACEGNDFVLKLAAVGAAFSPTTAFTWQNSSNTTVGTNDLSFNVSTYINLSSLSLPLPQLFHATVTDSNGCFTTKPFTVTSLYCAIQKGISPNGDGDNEFLDLHLLDVKALSIFNRYGMKVYSKSNYRDEWHGETNEGKQLPDGTYYYVIELNSNPEVKTGWIYINR